MCSELTSESTAIAAKDQSCKDIGFISFGRETCWGRVRRMHLIVGSGRHSELLEGSLSIISASEWNNCVASSLSETWAYSV